MVYVRIEVIATCTHYTYWPHMPFDIMCRLYTQTVINQHAKGSVYLTELASESAVLREC